MPGRDMAGLVGAVALMGVNYALLGNGSTAWARGNYNTATAAPKAIDGDPATRWVSDSPGYSSWLAVDLVIARTVNYARLIFANEGAWKPWNAYAVQGSHDGVTWLPVATEVNPSQAVDKTTAFAAIAYRFWRVQGTGAQPVDRVGLWTLELGSTTGLPDVPVEPCANITAWLAGLDAQIAPCVNTYLANH